MAFWHLFEVHISDYWSVNQNLVIGNTATHSFCVVYYRYIGTNNASGGYTDETVRNVEMLFFSSAVSCCVLIQHVLQVIRDTVSPNSCSGAGLVFFFYHVCHYCIKLYIWLWMIETCSTLNVTNHCSSGWLYLLLWIVWKLYSPLPIMASLLMLCFSCLCVFSS